METTRVDLHCHSSASRLSRLGVQRALGLPECATPPEEVYELAKRRGMDYVTITDHDTIAGVTGIADRPDVFVSEELTAWFRGEATAVHVLCWGISADDHDWLQRNARDLERCVEYLHVNAIACALAHPFYPVATPLEPRHRRRLAELFGVWEVHNGSRPSELNQPAAVYIEAHGGAGVGGSDDHAGVDVGRTWTETPPAADVDELLGHLRRGATTAAGDHGSAAKWAHTAIALAVRALSGDAMEAPAPQPGAVLGLVQQVMSQAAARGGPSPDELGPGDARALLRAWLDSLEPGSSGADLLAHMQADDFTHAALFRRARKTHERLLRGAVAGTSDHAPGLADRLGPLGADLFGACLPAIPYVTAAAFLGRELEPLSASAQTPRAALVVDGLGGVNGVTRTVAEIRERGVPGFDVEVIGTDPQVDRRLPAVAEAEIPFYPGYSVGVPSLPALAAKLAEGRYALVQLCSPGPAGVAAALIAGLLGVPVVGSYHTELAAYADIRSGDARLRLGMELALRAFYSRCAVVLSPSESADASLHALGVAPERIGRWDRGVDCTRFNPRLRSSAPRSSVTVLHAGRLTHEKGSALLADAFLAARRRDPRLQLVVAGGGPERDELAERLGRHATFTGWLDPDTLARLYANADMFLFTSATDTFGQVIAEAQASALPVLAVDRGGPRALIRNGETGLLREPEPEQLADALCELAASPPLRSRLATAALDAARQRTWERSLERLAGGYRRALPTPGVLSAGARTAA